MPSISVQPQQHAMQRSAGTVELELDLFPFTFRHTRGHDRQAMTGRGIVVFRLLIVWGPHIGTTFIAGNKRTCRGSEPLRRSHGSRIALRWLRWTLPVHLSMGCALASLIPCVLPVGAWSGWQTRQDAHMCWGVLVKDMSGVSRSVVVSVCVFVLHSCKSCYRRLVCRSLTLRHVCKSVVCRQMSLHSGRCVLHNKRPVVQFTALGCYFLFPS